MEQDESPNLLKLNSVLEYKAHYEKHYQRSEIITFDNIRVYFGESKFGHAFYENDQGKKGAKNRFSFKRAERMDWIKETLTNSNAEIYKGWNKDKHKYENTRRVSLLYQDFVVIIELSLKKDGTLKGNFITCYVADQSINKIKKSPKWSLEECMNDLQK